MTIEHFILGMMLTCGGIFILCIIALLVMAAKMLLKIGEMLDKLSGDS